MEEQLLGSDGWVVATEDVTPLFVDFDQKTLAKFRQAKHAEVLQNSSFAAHTALLHKMRSMLTAIQTRNLRFYYPLIGLAWKNLVLEPQMTGHPTAQSVFFYFRFYDSLADNSLLLAEYLVARPADVSLVLRVMDNLVKNARTAGFTYAPGFYEDLRLHYKDVHYDCVSLRNLWPFILVAPELQTPTPCAEVLISFCESFDTVYVADKGHGVTPALDLPLPTGVTHRPQTKHSNNLLIERLIDHSEASFTLILGHQPTQLCFTEDKLCQLIASKLGNSHPHYTALTQHSENRIKQNWISATRFTACLLLEHGARAFAIIARLKSDDKHYLFEEFAVYTVCRLLLVLLEFKE